MSANIKVNTSPEEVGPSFWTDMEAHARDPVDDTAQAVFFGPKEYSKLSPEELAYYIRWRRELSKGKMEKAVPGCIWLRVAEIADSKDMPLADALKEISAIRKGVKRTKLPFDLSPLDADLRISRGMPVDMDCAAGLGSRCMGTLSLESPPVPMSMYDIADLMGEPLTDPEKYEDKRFSELINKSIAKLDFFMRTTTSAGLAENHARREDWGHRVFQGFPYRGERNHAVPLFQFGLLGRVLLGVVRNTERNVYGMDVKVPQEFDGSMRSMVRSVYDNPKAAVETGVPKGRELQFKATSELITETMAQKSAGVSTSSSTSYPRVPTVLAEGVLKPLGKAASGPRSSAFMTEIKLNWTSDYTTQVQYTPSDNLTPDYSSMSQAQRRYYLHWRGRVRQGVYLDVDPGYLWLFACETVNLEPEKSVVLDVLGEVSRRYPFADPEGRPMNVVQRAYHDYAVLNGITDVDPSAVVSDYTMFHGFRRMLNGEIGFTPGVYRALGRTDSEPDGDCVMVLDRVMRCMDASDIWGVVHKGGRGVVEHVFRMFEGLEYAVPDDKRRIEVAIPDMLRNEALIASVGRLIDEAAASVGNYNAGGPRRHPVAECFGIRCGDLVEEMTESWFAEKNRPAESEESSDRRDRSRRRNDRRQRDGSEDDRGKGRRDRRDRPRKRDESQDERPKRAFKTEGFEEESGGKDGESDSGVPAEKPRRSRRRSEDVVEGAPEQKSEDVPDEPAREEKPRRSRRTRKTEEVGDAPADNESEAVQEKPRRGRGSKKSMGPAAVEAVVEKETEAGSASIESETVPEEKPRRSRRTRKVEEVPDAPMENESEAVREKPRRGRGSVKTGDAVPEAPMEAKPASDDAQKAFLKAVTPMQREYIGKVLAGEDVTDYLKAKRKSAKWMETALNNTAEKTIGSPVMSDGAFLDKWKPLLGKVGKS